MNIGLIDVDGHNFPNIALMKIASWHRSQGDTAEMAVPMYEHYDRIYASKVFTFSPDFNELELEEVVKIIPPHKITCYVLVGFNSTKEQDLYRLQTLKRLGILPFVQPYRDFERNIPPSQYCKDLARWANRAWLFKSMDFEDYEPRKGFKCSEYFK